MKSAPFKMHLPITEDEVLDLLKQYGEDARVIAGGQTLVPVLAMRVASPDHLIDINTLTFVAIHELAHITTKSIGHKSEFWENFKFLLEEAKSAGIHQPEDYKKKPKEYCGMKITDNPYYDL